MLNCTRCANTFASLADMRTHMSMAHSVTVACSGVRLAPKRERFKSRSPLPQYSAGLDDTVASTSSKGQVRSTVNQKSAVERKPAPSTFSHQCDVCLAGFSKGNKLRIHMRSHTGERPYQCDICEMSFSNNSTLTRAFPRHRQRQTGCVPPDMDVDMNERSPAYGLHKVALENGKIGYQCTMCDKVCHRPSLLHRHFRSHTGERPFKCSLCERAFGTKTHMTRHVAQVHRLTL